MMRLRLSKPILWLALLASVLTSGCATNTRQYDYAAFKESRPKSILILPPINNSPDIKASYSMLSTMTFPVAESGYYVLPVTLVDQALKENGLQNPVEMHGAPATKLREIFGADAALYVTIEKFGASYAVIISQVVVAAKATLIDLRSGKILWSGQASASSSEEQSNSGGGLIGLLITAVVQQIVNNVSDNSHHIADIANQRLLTAGHHNGLLYGPRSAKYGTD